jgi:amino acid adenylation domain-containing protein
LPISTRQAEVRKAFVLADAGAAMLIVGEDAAPSPDLRIPTYRARDLVARKASGQGVVAPRVAASDVAYIAYTSGSTGVPKGVPITYEGLANRILWMMRYYDFGKSDALILKCEIDFDPSLFEILMPLVSGGRMAAMKGKGQLSADLLIRFIHEERVTFLNLVPLVLRQLLLNKSAHLCASLRHIVCGGEAWTGHLIDETQRVFPHARLYNGYGPTEASIGVTVWRHDPSRPTPNVPPIGKPIDNVQLAIVPADVSDVGNRDEAIEGELWIGGLAVSRGYLGARPENSSFVMAYQAGGGSTRYYRTGDIVRLNEDGDLVYVSRRDHQVKINGQRIELEEIEAIANRHPKVVKSVARVRHLGNLSFIQLLVESADFSDEMSEALKRRLQAELKPQFVPSVIRRINEVPVSSNGKIDRKKIEGES